MSRSIGRTAIGCVGFIVTAWVLIVAIALFFWSAYAAVSWVAEGFTR